MYNDDDYINFRDGIFALNTRRFGSVAEIMIKKLFILEPSENNTYDLYDASKELRVEVKFSRATKNNNEIIQDANVIEQCLQASDLRNRSLTSNEVHLFNFDSNIQQVKTRYFDFLYYGLFFIDCIEIYGVTSEIVHTSLPGYSDRQHAGNLGEGQFHINNNSIDFHRQNCLIKVLTYKELFNLFRTEQK